MRIDELDRSALSGIKKTPFILELNWIEIKNGSNLIGKSIKDLEIRSKTGISIVGILHEGKLILNPDIDFVFGINDFIAIIGSIEDIAFFDKSMM